jgi:Tfp pilus assembly protein PilO
MRGLPRLTPLVVLIAGTIIFVAVAAIGYFGFIQKKSADLQAQIQRYTPDAQYYDPTQDATAIAAAKKQLADATAQATIVDNQWNYILDTKNPDIDYSDRWQSWLEWASEVDYDFSPRLNSFLKHTGVTSLTTIGAPTLPSDPNDVPTGLLAAPLPNISVFGSYDQILNHVASWNKFSRIVLVDHLSLKGYSPFMTGTYSATEYMFTRHSDAPGPPVPSGGANATGTPVVPTRIISFDQEPGFNGKAP